jgi:acyl-CoA thioester hydrolase
LIVERHLDTFGHVNNATYLEILEEARWDWITSGGYGLDEVRKLGQGPTILECTLRFRRELRNREPVVIESWIESFVGKTATILQEITKPEGLACEASFIMGLFDLKARKLIEPTERWLQTFGLTLADWKASLLPPKT